MKPIHLRNIPDGPDNRIGLSFSSGGQTYSSLETFKHTDFFSLLFSWIKPERFLELGVRNGSNFLALSKFCKKSIAVDIIPKEFELGGNMEYHHMSTDQYFSGLCDGEMFDVVFIDANHSHEQSLKDFMSVKDRVIIDGFILLHDTYPHSFALTDPQFCNDVYKTALHIKQNFSEEFEVITLPFNPGVTIIKKMPINRQMMYLNGSGESSKNIIVFGSNGMLGSYLKKYLQNKHNVIPITRHDLDVSIIDKDKILEFIKSRVTENDIIINAVGVIKQRKYTPIDMTMVNSLFPHILAQAKLDIGCQVIHITTDCVFSGNDGNYTEEDKHDCVDDYGKSKSLGENPTLTNIRTSIIGEENLNKVSLLEWVLSNKGGVVNGYKDHMWNGVTCLELAKFIESLIDGDEYWEGTRHVFSPETVSKYDLLVMINEIYDLKMTINPKYGTKCYRNLSSNYQPKINSPLYNQIEELKKFNIK